MRTNLCIIIIYYYYIFLFSLKEYLISFEVSSRPPIKSSCTIPVSHSVRAFHFQLQTTLDAAELEAENERKLRVSAEMLCRELEEKLESLKTGKSQSVQNAQAVQEVNRYDRVQEVNRYERVSTLESVVHRLGR